MSAIDNLRLVEIELFSFCNRVCEWCPNSFIDRTFTKEIDDVVFMGLLLELRSKGYKNPITFSRYNEPLSRHEILKKRISQIKAILPDNKLITNTNGDYLENEVLDDLLIDELTIMDYDGIGVDKCIEKLEAVGATIDKIKLPYIYAHRNKMDILYVVDWQNIRQITDRGGSLPKYSGEIRQRKCYEPTYFIGVNYDGTISPCCNVRNDLEENKAYISGDLHENTLSEILESEKATNFRNDCAMAKFTEGSPCYRCDNTGGRYTRGGASIDYE